MPREVPEGWRLGRLHQLSKLTAGGTPSRGRADYYGGDIPWLKSGEINQGRIWIFDRPLPYGWHNCFRNHNCWETVARHKEKNRGDHREEPSESRRRDGGNELAETQRVIRPCSLLPDVITALQKWFTGPPSFINASRKFLTFEGSLSVITGLILNVESRTYAPFTY